MQILFLLYSGSILTLDGYSTKQRKVVMHLFLSECPHMALPFKRRELFRHIPPNTGALSPPRSPTPTAQSSDAGAHGGRGGGGWWRGSVGESDTCVTNNTSHLVRS